MYHHTLHPPFIGQLLHWTLISTLLSIFIHKVPNQYIDILGDTNADILQIKLFLCILATYPHSDNIYLNKYFEGRLPNRRLSISFCQFKESIDPYLGISVDIVAVGYKQTNEKRKHMFVS